MLKQVFHVRKRSFSNSLITNLLFISGVGPRIISFYLISANHTVYLKANSVFLRCQEVKRYFMKITVVGFSVVSSEVIGRRFYLQVYQQSLRLSGVGNTIYQG